MALIQLLLPIIVILAFIVFKLKHEQKRLLFKCPIWISSTALSFLIGHMAGGVMGFYAAAFCDLILYPAMLLVHKAWKKIDERKHPEKQALRSKSLALVAVPVS